MSTLGVAAAALEAELRHYEELALELQNGRLVTEKDLRRAAQGLSALRDSDARLGELVQGLVGAIGAVRDRQQRQADAVQARAEQIRRRSEVLGELLVRWEALGTGASEVNRLIGEPNGTEGGNRLGLEEVDERLVRLADDARSLMDAAGAEEFTDLARRAESLRAQLLSARNKLRSLGKE